MYQGKDLENLVKTVSNSEDGLNFIHYLVDDLGTFTTKVNVVDGKLQNIEKVIKKEVGESILELLRIHNLKKYIELQERRSNEKWQKSLN
jgi:hypothetical protein